MSLQVWLPLNGNLNNQGLSEVTVTNSGATVDSNGKIGSCYLFNPAKLSLTPSFITSFHGDFSFSLWLKVNSFTTSWETYLQIGIGTAPWNSYRIGLLRDAGTSNLIFCIGDGNSSTQNNCQTSYSAGDWYHFTCTYSKIEQKMRIYKNGVLSNTHSTSIVPKFSDVPYITLGQVNDGSYKTNCLMNDFRLYDHCLSAKEVKEISKGLICHYKLDNNGFGNPNLCPLTNKQEWTAVNTKTNYTILSSSTSNFGLSVRDTFTWSMYVKVPTEIKTLRARVQFYNSGSDRPSFSGSTYVTSGEGRIFVTGTVPSGYAEMQLLVDYNLSSDITTTNVECYYKMPKLEKGSVATHWCPHTSDSLYASLGLDSAAEVDCSGYRNDGNRIGNVLPSSESGRYSTSTYCNSTNIEIDTLEGAAFIKCNLVNPIINAATLTINWWGNIEKYSYNNSGVVSLSNDSSYPYDYTTSALAQYDSVFRFNLADGSDSSISSLALIETGNWHMYTLVFNNGAVQGYRDGVSIVSSSKSGTLAQFAYVYMGINAAGAATRKTKSKWSDFRIYSTALSASDIKELYNTSASIDKNGNMYAYEFKEE